jgi:quinohemoprotein ethanol dehydrogenase
MLRRTLPVLIGAGLLALAALPVIGADIAAATANWSTHDGDQNQNGFSKLDSVNANTIKRLGLAWSLDLDGEHMLEATPLAVDGVLYFTGSHAVVYAVDAASGKMLWKHDPEDWKHNPNKLRITLAANRGAAYADGRIFVGSLDGRLIALDAKSGNLLWSVETVARDSVHTSTGAPLAFNGKVLIGNGGADYGGRGYVTAYDAVTGRQVWRFYTAPGSPEENKGDPAMERAAATWSGEYWKTGTGGTVWNGMTFDPELNRVYIGTGNAGPYDPTVRSPGNGDNLYLASIVALDADTGKYVWHYQVNPREAWDFKATANIIAATIAVDGKSRKVLMQAPTNGFFYVLDRETGKLLSAEKTGKVTWAKSIDLATGRPVEEPNIRYETGETVMWPTSLGTHNWQDMSFNPQTGLVYIPYMQLGSRLTNRGGQSSSSSFAQLSMGFVKADADDGKGKLLAWDPSTQKARWKVSLDTFWNGGTLTTAGNLVFQGAADGYFSAYNATTGERLWRFNAGLGIIAAPITYTAGGKQYVSVLVGYGGAGWGEVINVGWKFGAQPRRILTFSLDGKAVLPPTAPADMSVKALDDPALNLNEADVKAGAFLFLANCAGCHGPGLKGSGTAPDLRESQIALHAGSLWPVVHDGLLLSRGMPKFDLLTRQQVDQIHTYIRAGAREALGLRKPESAESGKL